MHQSVSHSSHTAAKVSQGHPDTLDNRPGGHLTCVQEWGATTVLSGHDHTYERIIDPESPGSGPGFPYFVSCWEEGGYCCVSECTSSPWC
jgi:hypothetical protein